ncbi:hypothetical protein QCA50_012541 [Cerrena zonata]|uniref:Uncharacterized protein n=1 Tax=Cerrena zonata TaxID=2478898 RepID=A0AAW0FVN8_9APHY
MLEPEDSEAAEAEGAAEEVVPTDDVDVVAGYVVHEAEVEATKVETIADKLEDMTS